MGFGRAFSSPESRIVDHPNIYGVIPAPAIGHAARNTLWHKFICGIVVRPVHSDLFVSENSGLQNLLA